MTADIRTLVFLLFVITASASAQQANPCSDEGPYDFTTRLSGGYRLEFTTDDESKYLHLWTGKKKIGELSSVSCGLLDKNLGYVAADFPNYFAFVSSFGAGNSNPVRLIRKVDGADMLKDGADNCWIGADVRNSLLIYSNACVPKAKSRIVLFNLRSLKKRYLYFPEIVLSGPEALSRISIASISRGYVTIRFEEFDGKRSIQRRYRY